MTDEPMDVAIAHWFGIAMDKVRGIHNVIATLSGYDGDDAYAFVLYYDSSGYYVVESNYCSCCSMPEWEPRKIDKSEIRQALNAAAEIAAGMS